MVHQGWGPLPPGEGGKGVPRGEGLMVDSGRHTGPQLIVTGTSPAPEIFPQPGILSVLVSFS